MPRVRTAKALARRIDLQYFTRPHAFRTWRLWLSVAVPLIALGWLIFTRGTSSQNLYSSGPLSSAHAVLTKNCQVCHLQDASFRAHVQDNSCLGCHDAPTHSARQTFTPQCSSCHVEHQGHPRLAETSDASCAQCHGDLQTTDGQMSIDPHVSSFDKKHPEFAPLRAGYKDPGTINLNHYVHLQPTTRGPKGAVQMVCNDCHRPLNVKEPWPYSVAEIQPASQQPVDVTATNLQQRKRRSVESGAGGLMARIRYVNQCAACHVLQFDKLIPEPAPHDQPAVVHTFILKKYTDYIQAHPDAIRQPVEDVSVEDVFDSRRETLRPTRVDTLVLASSSQDWIQQRTQQAETLLWAKNCSRCHASTEHEGTGLPQSVKAVIPSRWLPRSEFDHQSHRMLACLSCHRGIPDSQRTADINLPGIQLCQQCHKSGGPSQLAAEGRCFECHSYHDWRKERRINGIMDMMPPTN